MPALTTTHPPLSRLAQYRNSIAYTGRTYTVVTSVAVEVVQGFSNPARTLSKIRDHILSLPLVTTLGSGMLESFMLV